MTDAMRAWFGRQLPQRAVPFRCNCSWGVYVIEPPTSVDLLPTNIVESVGVGFASCRSVRFEILSREVDLAAYPVGYFGDFTYRGRLVVERVTLASQDDVLFAFRLLAEASRGDWLNDVLIFDEVPTQEEFRELESFVPDMRVIFEGDDEVAIDVDTVHGTAIVSAGGKWSALYVQSSTFLILADLAKRIGTQNAQPGATDNLDGA